MNETFPNIMTKNILHRIWGSHSSYEESDLLENNTAQYAESQPKFRTNMSPPSSGVKNNPSKKRALGRQQAWSYTSTPSYVLMVSFTFPYPQSHYNYMVFNER